MDKKEIAAQKFKERTASKRFKLPEGNTTFRVLPNARGLDKAEYIEYAMHSNVGARKAYLRCGRTMAGEGECWLCDILIPKLEKSGKSSHKAAAEALKRKECFAVQIAYESDGKWVGPTLWEMSTGVANKLLNVMSRRDVSHPQKGYNLVISRTGTTMTGTRYGDIDRDDDKSEVDEEILKKLKPFKEVLKAYDEKVMKAEYYGHEQDEDDQPEEEEVKPKKKPAAEEEEEEEAPKPKKPFKKPVPVETESEDEETTEEEEEAPAKKPAKKPKPAEEEEETEEKEETEEDDIPDLEDEEEAPKKKPVKKPRNEEEEESEETEEADEEEEAPKPKKKVNKPAEEEEEEAPKPKKKPKPADDDDE